MVDDPAGQLFEEGAVGVHEHRLLVLHRFVAALAEPCGVIEITSRHSLEDEKEAGEERKMVTSRAMSRGEGSLRKE